MRDYTVVIKGTRTEDDALTIEMGQVRPGQAWWDLPLPPCPDCGGDVVWYEAGYVPGTRKCMGRPVDHDVRDGAAIYAQDGGCGSLFSVQTTTRRVTLRRERFY